MNKLRMLLLIPVSLVISLFSIMTAFSPDVPPEKAIQWNQWEHTLKSKKKYESQPADVEVIFKGPNGESMKAHTFSDDGKVYRFRAAFPAPGNWTWVSTCNNMKERGLKNKRGKVIVESYTGENSLYSHGDLKVSDDNRYLVYADGTPFLWMGETGWRATQNSSPQEWRDYIDTRKSQKFTVIQISPRGVSKKPVTELEDVSFSNDGKPDPKFWEDLEAKISYANKQGLVIFMVGMGKAWRDHFALNPANQNFESYITARMARLMVIFSPSFDQLWDTGNDSVAMELNRLTTHLVTQHPGTNYEANLKFRNSPFTDFCGMQSGHHGGRLERAYNAARQWTLDMWNGTPVKPVINIEAMYDAYGHNNAGNWREKDARKLGWITWLSGSKGYTYGAGDVPPKVPIGAGGIWRFNQDTSSYDYWRKAILWPSAAQMSIMHDFFQSVEWWNLVPSHELVLNQASDDTLKMVASKSVHDDLLLAYLPDNKAVVLDLSGFKGPAKSAWFNPVSGEIIRTELSFTPLNRMTFSKPGHWEDALLIIKKSDLNKIK